MGPREFQTKYACTADGVELLRLALGFVVYFSGDLARHRRGLTAAVETAWPLVESGVRSVQTTNMKRPKATKDGRKVLLQMLSEPPSEIYNYVSVDNRRDLNEAPDCCIRIGDASYRSSGYLLCNVPVGDNAHEPMLAALLEIASQWEFAHGYAGYTLACNVDGPKSVLPKRMFYPIGMRHPGLDLPSADNTSFTVEQGIKRVNWLTLLGADVARRAGTLGALARQPEVRVHEPGAAIVIQAGDAPVIGDTNRNETCEAYRRVGRSLARIRSTAHPAFVYGPGDFMGSEEKTQAWLSSLDD